jgi:hypothetical protein
MSESTVAQQFSLPLPRFHFGNALEAAIHAASIDNHNQREQLDQEQRIDRAQIEADEAEENEALWHDWCERHQSELIDMNGGVL